MFSHEIKLSIGFIINKIIDYFILIRFEFILIIIISNRISISNSLSSKIIIMIITNMISNISIIYTLLTLNHIQLVYKYLLELLAPIMVASSTSQVVSVVIGVQ